MHTLHRHIFLSVLLTCAVATGLFAFVLLAANAFKDLLGFALAGQLSPGVIFGLLPLLLPYVLIYALPLGVLTGVLLVLGRMSAQQEITAMRAAGLGVGYLARPVLLLGALGSVLALEINCELMPRTRATYRAILADAVRQNPLGVIVPKTFVRNFPDVVFYAGEKQGNLLQDVWVERLDPDKRATELLHALRGRVDYDEQANTLQLTLLGNVITDRRDPKDPEHFSNTDLLGTAQTMPFPAWNLDALFGPRTALQTKPAFLTLEQLLAEREQLAAPPPAVSDPATRAQARMKVEVALHEKAAGALTVLTFALLGVPLGIRVSRRETSANLAVAVALALGFYLLSESIHWLEKYPASRPDLLQWAPPALFLLLGAWLFHRAGRV